MIVEITSYKKQPVIASEMVNRIINVLTLYIPFLPVFNHTQCSIIFLYRAQLEDLKWIEDEAGLYINHCIHLFRFEVLSQM